MSVGSDVQDFHDKMGVVTVDYTDDEAVRQRLTLIQEEYLEMWAAFREEDPEAILKELCDLVYVVAGTAVKFGWNFDEAFKRVHESNMQKVWDDGKVHYREGDGKVLKPPHYRPPYLGDLI